jgi:hypothetical protein
VTHSHSHSLGSGPSGLDPLPAKIVVGLLVAIGVAVLASAALLWPSRQHVDIPMPFQNAAGGAVSTQKGHVLSSALGDCGSPSAGQVITTAPQPAAPGAGRCIQTLIGIDSGPNAGAKTLLESSPGPGQPHFGAGDRVRLVRQVDEQGTTSYAFYDFERGWPLVALAVAFAAAWLIGRNTNVDVAQEAAWLVPAIRESARSVRRSGGGAQARAAARRSDA